MVELVAPTDNGGISSSADLKKYAVHADKEIFGMMKVANAGMNIITLDACRVEKICGPCR